MKSTDKKGWAGKIPLPAALTLAEVDQVVVQLPGVGGLSRFDLVELRWAAGSVRLFATWRDALLPRDVGALAEDLKTALERWRQREAVAGSGVVLPALATEHATAKVLQACAEQEIALLDRTGALALSGEGLFVQVSGTAPKKHAAGAEPFDVQGRRVVRLLLAAGRESRSARELSKRSKVGYAHAQAVLARLEQEGLVVHASARAGFHLEDPAALLRAWIDSGEDTATCAEGFHAPDASPEALARAGAALRAAGSTFAFTLASALPPGEAAGLPHGLYLAGDAAPAVEALGLEREGEPDFFVLRADPKELSEAGGVLVGARELPQGRAVALPQLAVDLAVRGGAEAAGRLLERLAAAAAS